LLSDIPQNATNPMTSPHFLHFRTKKKVLPSQKKNCEPETRTTLNHAKKSPHQEIRNNEVIHAVKMKINDKE
jgi:hypothetical protein